MRQLFRLVTIIAAGATALLAAPAVLAHAYAHTTGADYPVYAETDDPPGNPIVVYARHDLGTLT